MPSWVAPSVAAEIWGVSVDHILSGIANGSIPSFVDGQFLFVDMAGHGFAQSTPRRETRVTAEEIRALTFEPIVRPAQNDSAEEDEDIPIDEDDSDSSRDVALWRTARQQASHFRRPPESEAA